MLSVSWQALTSFYHFILNQELGVKANRSSLPFTGLLYIEHCQARASNRFLFKLWSPMNGMHEKFFHRRDSNPGQPSFTYKTFDFVKGQVILLISNVLNFSNMFTILDFVKWKSNVQNSWQQPEQMVGGKNMIKFEQGIRIKSFKSYWSFERLEEKCFEQKNDAV